MAVTGEGTLKAQNNPLSADLGKDYKNIRDYFIRAAEKIAGGGLWVQAIADVRKLLPSR